MHHEFWEEYLDPSNLSFRKSNEARTSFRALSGQVDRADNGDIVLTDGYNKIVLPKLGLTSLQNLDYMNIVVEVQRRNAATSFSECKMQRIWQGLVDSVYHYEPESARKKQLAVISSGSARKYWNAFSDRRLAQRVLQKRNRPIAADFLDEPPSRMTNDAAELNDFEDNDGDDEMASRDKLAVDLEDTHVENTSMNAPEMVKNADGKLLMLHRS